MATLIHRSRKGRGALWQGGADDVASGVPYDVVVLCADEFQPEASLIAHHDTEVIHAPNDDSERPLTKDQVDHAIRAARAVAIAYRSGKTVLVSCMQGRNRSGLVTALTLHLLYGLSGDEARRFIRTKVPTALTNDHFERFLHKVPSRETSP